MKILFICNQNINRSRTAEAIFKKEYETKSAGLYNEHPVTEEHLAWADVIIVMEEEQHIELQKRFPKLTKPIYCLNIPDNYFYMEPDLITLLKTKMQELDLKRHA